MAIQKEKELDDIFDAFKEENEAQFHSAETETDVPLESTSDNSMFIDAYNTVEALLKIEISGVSIGVWLILLTISIVASWFVLRVVNKVKEHSDKALYEEAKNYVHKAGDLNQRTLPFSLFAVLIILLFIEASGFSYVFSDLMIDNASESILHYAMIFGGFVVSVVLMFMTHFSGEEMHRNSVLKAVENEMHSLDKDVILKDKTNFPRNKVSLEHTLLDDNAKTVVVPQYNRMHQKYFDWKNFRTLRKIYITSSALIFILSIGIGAMFVRFYVYENNVDHQEKKFDATSTSFNVKTDLFKEQSKGEVKIKKETSAIPSYYLKQSKLREKYQRNSKVEAERRASYITYAVMMMLFFGIQAVGLIIGNKYSFVGKESKKAYKTIASYKEQV